MINDCIVVLMTQKLTEQKHFYLNTLGLDLVFDNTDTIGIGRGSNLFMVIREDHSENSHHVTEQKGPVIITFKCSGKLDATLQTIADAGYKIRDTVELPEHNTQFLFVEDAESNEICLDFPLQ